MKPNCDAFNEELGDNFMIFIHKTENCMRLTIIYYLIIVWGLILLNYALKTNVTTPTKHAII